VRWLAAGSTREALPVGVPDRCSAKDVTWPVVKVSTSSVLGRPSRPGVRTARLTCVTRPPAAPARRTSPSSPGEDVLKLSPTRAGEEATTMLAGGVVSLARCAEVMG
jgi:hypothetical protein